MWGRANPRLVGESGTTFKYVRDYRKRIERQEEDAAKRETTLAFDRLLHKSARTQERFVSLKITATRGRWRIRIAGQLLENSHFDSLLFQKCCNAAVLEVFDGESCRRVP